MSTHWNSLGIGIYWAQLAPWSTPPIPPPHPNIPTQGKQIWGKGQVKNEAKGCMATRRNWKLTKDEAKVAWLAKAGRGLHSSGRLASISGATRWKAPNLNNTTLISSPPMALLGGGHNEFAEPLAINTEIRAKWFPSPRVQTFTMKSKHANLPCSCLVSCRRILYALFKCLKDWAVLECMPLDPLFHSSVLFFLLKRSDNVVIVFLLFTWDRLAGN